MVRAIAGAEPRCLILLDSSEYNLFEIDRRVESAFARVPHEALLGTVDDTELLDHMFARFHPEIIYHAAAFKHVPLLERNPIAAVRNNAIGTWVLAQAAVRHGCSNLALISTDKAVNPHSVMGVSKRIAELAIVALSGAGCRMNAIRLVNVFGSGGSVVPMFEKQIAEGGPVTVTHPEASRWFLSLQETVEAVLACGAAGCDGRILLPKVGEPRRIVDLAESLMREAGKQVPIRFIGLRPGDKLAEELMYKTETQDGLAEGGLEVLKTSALGRSELEGVMERLSGCVAGRDVSGLIRTLSDVVPEYTMARAAGV